jgi:hypothetical protein
MKRVICILSLLGLTACADAPLEAESTEAAPEAPGDDFALKGGTVRCDPWQTTGYQDGQPFGITVVEVDGKPVELRTANAYAVMQAAAAADGVSLRIYSGFRRHEEQAYLYQCYVDCDCNQCNLAAPPGYSNHQSGFALDLNTEGPGVYTWLDRHARSFGFARTVPSEDWHWEHFGDGPGGGPCQADGSAAPSSVRLVGLRDGTRWTNGQWLKLEGALEGVHHVRYDVDGYDVGSSEDATEAFPVRVVLHQLGARTVRARAYDVGHRLVAEAAVSVTFVAGAEPGFSLKFDGLQDLGWYRNGVVLKVGAVPAGTARVEYSAGRYVLGEGDAARAGHPVRVRFHTLGHRALLARALDADGRERARTTLLIRVLPGDDTGLEPAIEFLAPAPEGTLTNGAALQVAASDRVKAVRFSADGYAIGPARLEGGKWVRSHRFSRTGARRLLAEGLDGAGQVIVRAEVGATVQAPPGR